MIALAKNGVFFSVQGEGHLQGQPMVFVRLAGCSVGCPQCDTDYAVAERVEISTICDRVKAAMPGTIRDRWVWITGGEPTDCPRLNDLVRALKTYGYAVAVATAGTRRVVAPVDWLSVSPHGGELVQRYGNEIKLVPGLNGLDAFKWIEENDRSIDFWLRFLQPLAWPEASDGREQCMRVHRNFPHWGLSLQAHKYWMLP